MTTYDKGVKMTIEDRVFNTNFGYDEALVEYNDAQADYDVQEERIESLEKTLRQEVAHLASLKEKRNDARILLIKAARREGKPSIF